MSFVDVIDRWSGDTGAGHFVVVLPFVAASALYAKDAKPIYAQIANSPVVTKTALEFGTPELGEVLLNAYAFGSYALALPLGWRCVAAD